MPTPILMPRQGQSVDSCVIVEWKKAKGDAVSAGEVICEIETDKATFDVECPEDGVLLDIFFQEGDDVAVLTAIAAVGAAGESVDDLRPSDEPSPASEMSEMSDPAEAPAVPAVPEAREVPEPPKPSEPRETRAGVSPRARRMASEQGVDADGLTGSGPGGRVIERDIVAALQSAPPTRPAASAAPAATVGVVRAPTTTDDDTFEDVPVKGARKIIAERMLASLQQTAQLTLHATADAERMLDCRQRFKDAPEDFGLGGVTINDLVHFAAVHTLKRHPELNSFFLGDTIRRMHSVHLAFAVDTPRGLLVPVIRRADCYGIRELALESRRLAGLCIDGDIRPGDMQGGTFTVSNLGNLGVTSFTPVLNPPQVAILGVGGIEMKPVMRDGDVAFVRHIHLSLTINHQSVDGAPAGRFLKDLADTIATIDLALVS